MQGPSFFIDPVMTSQLVSSGEYFNGIALYQKRQLSLGKSAQFLGMDRLSFVELLKQDDIPIFDYSTKEMSEVFDDADDLVDILK